MEVKNVSKKVVVVALFWGSSGTTSMPKTLMFSLWALKRSNDDAVCQTLVLKLAAARGVPYSKALAASGKCSASGARGEAAARKIVRELLQ